MGPMQVFRFLARLTLRLITAFFPFERRGKDYIAPNIAFWDGRDVFVGGSFTLRVLCFRLTAGTACSWLERSPPRGANVCTQKFIPITDCPIRTYMQVHLTIFANARVPPKNQATRRNIPHEQLI